MNHEAYKLGMRKRSNNVSYEDLRKEIDEMPLSESVYETDIVRGWHYMDNLIFAIDLLEGRA